MYLRRLPRLLLPFIIWLVVFISISSARQLNLDSGYDQNRADQNHESYQQLLTIQPVRTLNTMGIDATSQIRNWPELPWQKGSDWVPAYSKHVNDLPSLISSQRRKGINWLTAFALTNITEGSQDYLLFLNTLTSYLYFGAGESYIVVIGSHAALETCMRLKLPCYNATEYLPSEYLNGYTYGTWAKVIMSQLVLKSLPSDLNLHISDHDVVYLKKVIPTVEKFAKGIYFDVLAQFEDFPVRGINTGVFFLRNTPKVHIMYEEWLKTSNPLLNDQVTFVHLSGKLFVLHTDPTAPHNESLAVIVRHNAPWVADFWCNFCGPTFKECWRNDNPDHCMMSKRLYVHLICELDKMPFIHGLQLYFLDKSNPLLTNFTAIRAAGLPCASPLDVANLLFRP